MHSGSDRSSELVPSEYRDLCFYQGFDDLVDRLGSAIKNIGRIRQISLRDAVARFDWLELAAAYDDRLERVESRQ